MSEKLEIITDHRWKQLKYRYEVPKKVLKSEFDYQDPDEASDGFFKYRDRWYHLDQFTRVDTRIEGFEGYDGYLNDSFFSGVIIKLSDDGEEYQVATFIS